MSTPLLVTFLSWPRHPVAVQDALNEAGMPVMTRLDLKKMLLLASNKVEVVERMWKRMASVQLVKKWKPLVLIRRLLI